jgi:hypothetical protein
MAGLTGVEPACDINNKAARCNNASGFVFFPWNYQPRFVAVPSAVDLSFSRSS